MAEHRGKLVRAELRSNLALLESPPSLADYSPSQWATFHSLPLHTATAARILHTRCMERSENKNYLGRGYNKLIYVFRLAWPQWKRKIEDILQS